MPKDPPSITTIQLALRAAKQLVDAELPLMGPDTTYQRLSVERDRLALRAAAFPLVLRELLDNDWADDPLLPPDPAPDVKVLPDGQD